MSDENGFNFKQSQFKRDKKKGQRSILEDEGVESKSISSIWNNVMMIKSTKLGSYLLLVT